MNATKLDLCNRVAKKLGSIPVDGQTRPRKVVPADVKPVVEAFLSEILVVLSEGKRIEIRGFGSFSVKTRKARIGRNPRTGVTVNIPSYKIACFKFSREAQHIFGSLLKEPKT